TVRRQTHIAAGIRCGRDAAAPQNVSTQFLRCALRLDAELSPQRLLADRILLERLSSITAVVVEPYEAAMHLLLERIDGQKAQSRLHSLLAHSGPLLMMQELAQAFDCQGIEPPPLTDQPFHERALIKIETF